MTVAPQGPDNYVDLILGFRVTLVHVTSSIVPKLRELGAREQQIGHQEAWILEATSDQTLASLFGRLRDLGVLFVYQPCGWPPAAIFEDLREKGYVQGEFQAVTWRGPGQWRVFSR